MSGIDDALAFPALEAVFGRRARRFPLGGTLTGPLEYSSAEVPLALSAQEEAVLVAAASGTTGVVLEEWAFRDADGEPTGGDKLASFTGRTYPSPLANHSTEVFWTNDDGTFVLPQRDGRPRAYVQDREPADHALAHKGAVRLGVGRLDIPRARPNLFAFNRQLINAPGSTVFIPIADLTRQCISALLLYFDRPHGYYLVDRRLGGDPLRPFVESGLLDDTHPVDLADFERWQMVDANGVESGLVVANLLTATQALGLGGHPFSGGKGRVTMGGERHWHAIGGEGTAGGLGFRFHRVPDDAPIGAGEEIPVGLDGIFEGAVPPYHDTIEDAVDFVVGLRWGDDGAFTGDRPRPWRDERVVQRIPRPSEEAIAAVKTWVRYVWDAYGRFPATIDPFLTTVWYQAHHLDVGFYDRYYPGEAVPDHIRSHLARWHA
ncbi:hypothetical protein [Actinomadura macrotermitis]|uniref:Uncharacterized protein n=1 Tax=Actinomadura macrotermitis TaxID=2585200 RepID=A0A7K0BPA9_9ACTN|nr:hypothetical protein [Actinomadura macrotermitis]MQY02692.1 hypothetical protein [Actinomadura macrotermitis]